MRDSLTQLDSTPDSKEIAWLIARKSLGRNLTLAAKVAPLSGEFLTWQMPSSENKVTVCGAGAAEGLARGLKTEEG